MASKPKTNGTAPPAKSGFAPIKRTYVGLTVAGVVLVACAIAGTAISSGAVPWTTYVAPFVAGAFLMAFGVWGMRIGAVIPVLSSSYNLIQAGKLAEASERLDRVAGNRSRRVVAAVSIQRAMIAVRRGDLAEARRHLDVVAASPVRWIDGAAGEIQRSAALGLRAWVRAASDDLPGAESDIAAVRGAPPPHAEALAHASLAEALILEQRGDRGSLAALLRRDQRLLLGSLPSRERAVIRAMHRMLRAPAASVYRTKHDPKKTADDAREPPVAEWMSRVAPELLPFVPRTAEATAAPPAGAPFDFAPSAEAVSRVKAASKTGAGPWRRVLVLWGLLVAMFLGIWQFLQPSPGRPGRRRAARAVANQASALPLPVIAAGVIVVVLGAAVVRIVLLVRRARADVRRLCHLAAAVARGDDVDADLAALAGAKAESTAAQAELLRAATADRRGDVAASLAHIDAARAKIKTNAGRVATAGVVAPTLTASRAYALAALGRPDEAAAELSQLPPDYLFLDRMRFVVPLIALLARGDVDAASRLVASTSAELSLGARDELARDLLRAATSPQGVGSSEIARLRDELTDRPDERRWLQTIAPALLARFEHSVVGQERNTPEREWPPGDAMSGDAVSGDAMSAPGAASEAEREAAAETEAHAEIEAAASAVPPRNA